MAVKRIVRKFTEELERLGKTAVAQVTGTGEYDTRPEENKVLPLEEKQKIESQQKMMLEKINREIEEIRKKREQESGRAGEHEKKEKVVKKQEEKKKQHDKWAALKAMLKAREGSGENKKYGSG